MKFKEAVVEAVKENQLGVGYLVGLVVGGAAVGMIANNKIQKYKESLEFTKTASDLQHNMVMTTCLMGKMQSEEISELKKEIEELKKEKES